MLRILKRFEIQASIDGYSNRRSKFCLCDNKSILTNSSQSFSVLKKKWNAIAYHFVREGSAKDEWRIAYINRDDNCADMLTKPLVGMKRRKFTNMLLMWVYEGD